MMLTNVFCNTVQQNNLITVTQLFHFQLLDCDAVKKTQIKLLWYAEAKIFFLSVVAHL